MAPSPLDLCSVHVTNDDRGRKGVSWTKEVTVFVGVITVQLLQDWVVKVCALGQTYPKLTRFFLAKYFYYSFSFPQVNDELVSLPLLREPHIYIERQSNTILLNTDIGLKVESLFPRHHVHIIIIYIYKIILRDGKVQSHAIHV